MCELSRTKRFENNVFVICNPASWSTIPSLRRPRCFLDLNQDSLLTRKKTGKADFGAKEVFELFFSWKKALAGVLKFHFVSLEAKRSN